MNKNTENLKDIIKSDGDPSENIEKKIKEKQEFIRDKIEKTKTIRIKKEKRITSIVVSNYFGEGEPIRYRLEKPSLPEACGGCGAFKGSCFETRIMYLIPYFDLEKPRRLFLCVDCYLEADFKQPNPTII